MAHPVREPQSLPESYSLKFSINFFQIGTCAMKPREQGGVVDARLNVYGVQNLKIAGNYYIRVLPFFWTKYLSLPFRLQYRTRKRRS